jgi:matrix metalloproteinase-14 (membrane-inserted)
MDSGYPKSISDGFQGIPNSIDAAFVWSGNGKIYFFKGQSHFAE